MKIFFPFFFKKIFRGHQIEDIQLKRSTPHYFFECVSLCGKMWCRAVFRSQLNKMAAKSYICMLGPEYIPQQMAGEESRLNLCST